MVHERLQTDIVREDRLRSLAHASITTRGVRSRWVELGKQEPSL